jgi:hypothetical protein
MCVSPSSFLRDELLDLKTNQDFCSFRDLTGNQLSGSIPSALLKRMQDGSLILRSVHDTINTPLYCSITNFEIRINWYTFFLLDMVTIQTSAPTATRASLRKKRKALRLPCMLQFQ